MYDLTKEMVIDEIRKDLFREAERYYITSSYPSRPINSRGMYEKSLAYLDRRYQHWESVY